MGKFKIKNILLSSRSTLKIDFYIIVQSILLYAILVTEFIVTCMFMNFEETDFWNFTLQINTLSYMNISLHIIYKRKS